MLGLSMQHGMAMRQLHLHSHKQALGMTISHLLSKRLDELGEAAKDTAAKKTPPGASRKGSIPPPLVAKHTSDAELLSKIRRIDKPADLWVDEQGSLHEATKEVTNFDTDNVPRGTKDGLMTSLEWLLRFRSKVLLDVGRFIMEEQAGFFRGGPLVAMSQTRCAQALELHPTFVCKAIQGKSLIVRGVKYDLRFFFCMTQAHPHEVKRWLLEKIKGENPQAPLDDDLMEQWNADHPRDPCKTRRAWRKWRIVAGIQPRRKRYRFDMIVHKQ